MSAPVPLTGAGPWTEAEIEAAFPGFPPSFFRDDKTIEDCKARFPRLQLFRGAPHVPPQPSVRAMIERVVEAPSWAIRRKIVDEFFKADDGIPGGIDDGDEDTRL